VTQMAERRGVHGVWVVDRILSPVTQREPYPGRPDGVLPRLFDRTIDPLQVLAAAGARTFRIRLGTNVLVMPWYNPVTLARTLASLDVLTNGRLDVGLGLGFSADELRASGAPADAASGSRTDEFVDVLRRCLVGGTVEHHGEWFQVPATRLGLVPATPPPLYFAAFAPGSMARLARVGDGWLPSSLPFDVMMSMWAAIRGMADAGGRDPDELKLVVRAHKMSTQRAPDSGRGPFEGDARQVADDVRRCAELGVDEVIVDLQFTEAARSFTEYMDAMEAVLDQVSEHLDVPVRA
jgi:probable F420-dependent oxidoreductase